MTDGSDKRVAEDADVIVAVVGETTAMSGEASSRADITLPGQQRALLEAAPAPRLCSSICGM